MVEGKEFGVDLFAKVYGRRKRPREEDGGVRGEESIMVVEGSGRSTGEGGIVGGGGLDEDGNGGPMNIEDGEGDGEGMVLGQGGIVGKEIRGEEMGMGSDSGVDGENLSVGEEATIAGGDGEGASQDDDVTAAWDEALPVARVRYPSKKRREIIVIYSDSDTEYGGDDFESTDDVDEKDPNIILCVGAGIRETAPVQETG